jgi:hypothetical protein
MNQQDLKMKISPDGDIHMEIIKSKITKFKSLCYGIEWKKSLKPDYSHLPVLLIKSAKSPMESRSIRASLGWGALARTLEPVFEEGRGAGVKALAGLDTSTGGCECNPVSLLTDDECERLVFGLWLSLPFGIAGGLA